MAVPTRKRRLYDRPLIGGGPAGPKDESGGLGGENRVLCVTPALAHRVKGDWERGVNDRLAHGATMVDDAIKQSKCEYNRNTILNQDSMVVS